MRATSTYFGVCGAAATLVLTACSEVETSETEDPGAENIALASPCPTTGADMRGSTEPLVCSCSESDANIGVVFGSNPYLDDSGICASALHAGLLNEGPANIEITFSDGAGAEFPGSEANGIGSSPYINSSPPDGAMILQAAD